MLFWWGDFAPAGARTGEFRLRAGYFPTKESNQSSPGLRPRTPGEPFGRKAWWEIDRRGCRLVVVLTFPARCRSAVVEARFLLSLFRSAPGLTAIAGCGPKKQPSPGGRCPRRGRMRGALSTSEWFRYIREAKPFGAPLIRHGLRPRHLPQGKAGGVGADVLIGPFRWCSDCRGTLRTASPTKGPFLSIARDQGPPIPLIRPAVRATFPPVGGRPRAKPSPFQGEGGAAEPRRMRVPLDKRRLPKG